MRSRSPKVFICAAIILPVFKLLNLPDKDFMSWNEIGVASSIFITFYFIRVNYFDKKKKERDLKKVREYDNRNRMKPDQE